jgi:ComF family protein
MRPRGMPLDLLFPPVCVGCRRLLRGAPTLPLCSLCLPEHQPLPSPLRRVAAIEAVHAYAGPLARAITALKFSGQLELAGPLGRLLSGADLLRQRWDSLIPVPLHPWRAFLRGYNQAELLARWALRHARLPAACLAPRLLRRVRATPPQTAQDATTRRQNLSDAFAAAPAAAGRRLLVIDDVTTTGATLDACLAALREAGARDVAGLALLRTLA